MGIPSNRLLAILHEAEQHRQAFLDLRLAVTDTCMGQLENPLAQQLTQLISMLHNPPSNEMMLQERAHFKRFGKKNDSEKLRMRRKRQLQKQEHYDTLRDHGGQGLIDDTDLTDEQLAAVLREKGLMPTPTPAPPAHRPPAPAPVAAGLPGSDALNAANARTQAYDGTVDIFNPTDKS